MKETRKEARWRARLARVAFQEISQVSVERLLCRSRKRLIGLLPGGGGSPGMRDGTPRNNMKHSRIG